MTMALSWRNSIYQWLSKTTVETQPRRTQVDSPRPLDPLASLEAPHAKRREQGSVRGKRTRDSPNENQQDILEQRSSKRTRNEYERQPRRKTREDRYDYKPSGSRDKQKPRKDKKRRVRHGRKQTMNDGFHASNVARERLTLRQNANLGIFNKGKASSPIKIRDAPDLAFSERQFLTRMNSPVHKTPVDERNNRQKKESQPCGIRKQFAAKFATPSHTVVEYTSEQIRNKVGNPQCPLRYSDMSNLDRDGGPDGAHDTTQVLEGHLRASTQESRSATPFSWSESEPRSPLERAVERRLLNILHAGLSSEGSTKAIDTTDLHKGYCDLQGLKNLLELRKAHWDPDDSHADHIPQQSSHCGYLNQIAEVMAVEKRSTGSLNAVNPANPPSNCSNFLHRQSPLGNTSHRSQSFLGGEGTVTICTPYEGHQTEQLHADLEIEAENMEADKDFFRKLDEAFYEIMNSGSKKLEPTKERTEAQLSTSQSSLNMGDEPWRSLPRRNLLQRGHLPTLLYDQLGFDIPYMSPNHMDCRDMEEWAGEPENLCNLVDMPLQETQGTNHTRSNLPKELLLSTTPTDTEVERLPSGFWRPNKLY